MSSSPSLHRIGVVGAGLMGSGIAEVCARAGLDVLVGEIDADALAAGRARVERSLARAVRSGKLSRPAGEEARDRLSWTTELTDFADRELVVEAVAESERIKTEVFGRLDRIVKDPDAILASNSSSIPMVKLATATSRPGQVIGIHFFNPVPVLPLVELVPSLLTAERTAQRARDFVTEALGKQVIRSGDRAGFVVNALLVPYLLAAIRMLESGFASADDGPGHGPGLRPPAGSAGARRPDRARHRAGDRRVHVRGVQGTVALTPAAARADGPGGSAGAQVRSRVPRVRPSR